MTATDILSEFDTWAKQYSEGSQETASARSTQTQSVSRSEQLSAKLSQTAEAYHEELQSYKSALQKSKDAAKDAFADKNVAEENGPVSVGEALRMIEAEESSRKQHAANQRKYLEMNVKYAWDTITTGGQLLVATASESARGISDSLQDPKGMLALFGGAAAGLAFGNSGIVEDVQSATSYIFGLDGLKDNPVGEGVDVKDLGDMTPEEYAAYVNGEPNDPYDPGVGENADHESEVPLTAEAAIDPNVDALTQSEEQLATMAEIGNSQKEFIESLGLDPAAMEANPDLLASIASFSEIMTGAPEEVQDAYTQAMQDLFGMMPDDGQEESPEAEAEGIGC